MANVRIPDEIRDSIFKAVYEKANGYGYMRCDRVRSGQFMDLLLDDPNVGGLLKEYIPKEKLRTYIKDTILNRYTKAATKKALGSVTPKDTVWEVYGEDAEVIDTIASRGDDIYILRSGAGVIYVVSSGTELKWETALRKALEVIALKPTLYVDNKAPRICLKLAAPKDSLTEPDKTAIESALGAVGVKAVFCEVE